MTQVDVVTAVRLGHVLRVEALARSPVRRAIVEGDACVGVVRLEIGSHRLVGGQHTDGIGRTDGAASSLATASATSMLSWPVPRPIRLVPAPSFRPVTVRPMYRRRAVSTITSPPILGVWMPGAPARPESKPP